MKTITYVVTRDEEAWAARCPSGEVEGVAVADSLKQLERQLAEGHAWYWPTDAPGVEMAYDLPYSRQDEPAAPIAPGVRARQ